MSYAVLQSECRLKLIFKNPPLACREGGGNREKEQQQQQQAVGGDGSSGGDRSDRIVKDAVEQRRAFAQVRTRVELGARGMFHDPEKKSISRPSQISRPLLPVSFFYILSYICVFYPAPFKLPHPIKWGAEGFDRVRLWFWAMAIKGWEYRKGRDWINGGIERAGLMR